MAGDYYGKSASEVKLLPWEKQLDYYANNPTLYGQEMNRIEGVLAGNPNHTQGYRWQNQVREARDKVTSALGKYDFSKPQDSVITSIKPKYENQINDVIAQITAAANRQQAPINVQDDPRYQAQQKLMEGNVQKGQQQAMEQMNAKGLLMSDMTNDRMGQIEQEGIHSLNALVPQLYDSISNERYRDNQQEMNNLTTLFSAYTQEDQRSIDNQFNMNQLNLQERQMAFNEGLQMRNYNLAVDAWIQDTDLNERQFVVNKEATELNGALNKLSTLGSVTDPAMAALLGVPVGTPSWQAKEAAAQRAQQLAMHRQSLGAQANAQKAATINQLLAVWQASGKAPDGLQQFGVEPGQAMHQTPAEVLQGLMAMEETSKIQMDKAMMESAKDIQKTFGVDPNTAQAIYMTWENPTLDSAKSFLKSNTEIFKKEGITDFKTLNKAIEFKFSPGGQQSGKTFERFNIDYNNANPNFIQKVTNVKAPLIPTLDKKKSWKS